MSDRRTNPDKMSVECCVLRPLPTSTTRMEIPKESNERVVRRVESDIMDEYDAVVRLRPPVTVADGRRAG